MYDNLRLNITIEKYVEAFVIKFIMYPLFYNLTGILDILRIKGK